MQNDIRSRLRHLSFAAAMITLIVALVAAPEKVVVAQDATFPTLQEVVVTARKREESLQDAPISVAAFTAADISARGITSVSELGYATPNVQIDAGAPGSGSNAATTMFIRGIGQTDFTLSVDPGIGFYVDGVYYGQQMGTNVDFLALERVEVLKGPQGTLFGRNTIGGAVNIITKRPAREQQTSLRVALGSDKQADFSGSLDLPLADKLFSKVSMTARNRDGYVTRRTTGEKLGDVHNVSARGVLLWEASEQFKMTIDADVTRTREGVVPDVLIFVNPLAPIPSYHNAVLVGAPCLAPTAASDPRCFNSQWVDGSGKSEFGTYRSDSDLDLWGLALTSEYAGEAVNIKSITAYRQFSSFFSFDNDHSPLTIVEFPSAFESRQFTQEFQFSGALIGERLKWLGGLYYYDENAHDSNGVDFSIGSLAVGGDLDVTSYAAFGQMTFSATDRLDITIGARYTDEEKIRDPRSFLVTNLVLGPTLVLPAGTNLVPRGDAKLKASATTKMLNLAYKWTDRVMTYATYSEGFKGGGYTDRVSFPVPVVPTFKPETAESIEVGAKTSFFGNRLTANLAAFDTDYKNIQILVAAGIAPTTLNAAAARVRGAELEVQALPAPDLVVSLAAGYIDAEYTKVDPRATEITLDKKFPKTPKNSYSASIAYAFDVSGGGQIMPRVDWYRRSEVFNDSLNSPRAKQDAFDLVNASLTFRSASEKWSIRLLGQNLTDEKYLLNARENRAQGIASGTYARPRAWTLVLQADF